MTQTRTFVYDDAGRLTSATNPENGTVSYTYNSDNTLQYKHDAKGQDTVYTYDSQKRVTMIQRYPTGKSNAEDTCQRVTYSYDTNPYSTTFSQYTTGRLAAAKYYAGACLQLMTEMYSYHPAGVVTAKSLQVGTAGTMAVAYGYNTAGQVTTMQYPTTGAGWWTFNYGYDSMGRPSSLNETLPGSPSSSWVPAAQYDLAGRMSSLQYAAGAVYQGNNLVTVYTQETMGYNVNGQLTSLNWTWAPGSQGYLSVGPAGGIQYSYPAASSTTGNNGQISQAVDNLSGETITYLYDSLRRLTSATSTPLAGGVPSGWAETFGYDGFGNLTSKVLNGTSAPIAVNAGTNQLSNALYDFNGNMISGAGATLTYDVANRLASAAEVSGGVEYYGYAPDNKRVLRLLGNGHQEITFYGARGEKLATGTINSAGILSTVSQSVWFGGRLIWDAGVPVYLDRVGTNRGNGTGSTSSPPYVNNVERFLPYGEELTSTSNDREKFGTYTRGQLHRGWIMRISASMRSTYGRFNDSRTRIRRVVARSDPGSWNRYSYTRGDPVNRFDPRGTDDCDPIIEISEGCPSDPSVCPDADNPSCMSYIPPDTPASGGSICNSTPTILAYTNPSSYAGCYGGASIIQTAAPAGPSCDDVLTAEITTELSTYRGGTSPLDTTANIQALVAAGDQDDVDPRFITALAGAESQMGTNITWGPYEAWNVSPHRTVYPNNGKRHPQHQPYTSWNQAINDVTSLANSYLANGLTTTATFYPLYQGPGFEKGLKNVNFFLTAMGGNVNSLTDPCHK